MCICVFFVIITLWGPDFSHNVIKTCNFACCGVIPPWLVCHELTMTQQGQLHWGTCLYVFGLWLQTKIPTGNPDDAGSTCKPHTRRAKVGFDLTTGLGSRANHSAFDSNHNNNDNSPLINIFYASAIRRAAGRHGDSASGNICTNIWISLLCPPRVLFMCIYLVPRLHFI